MIGITRCPRRSTGHQIYLVFIITQHIRDELLMKYLMDYLDCGRLRRKRDVYEFQVSKFSDVAVACPPGWRSQSGGHATTLR